MIAAVPDRFTEFACEGTFLALLVVMAMVVLGGMLRRDQPERPPDRPKRW